MSLIQIFSLLAEGMLRSVLIFVLTLVFSLPLGLLVSFGRMSKWRPFRFLDDKCKRLAEQGRKNRVLSFIASLKPVQLLIKLYISVMRGTPLMLQVMVIYFGPYYIFGVRLSLTYQFYAVIIAFSINYAAYFAEIYRSGIESIPKGQYEAAKVLGYSKGKTFFRIILPQVIKRILPPVTNETITLVKDTSLAFVIAYAEMFTLAKRIAAKEASMLPFLAAAIFYYVFNLIVAVVMERIERRLSYYE